MAFTSALTASSMCWGVVANLALPLTELGLANELLVDTDGLGRLRLAETGLQPGLTEFDQKATVPSCVD